MPPASVLLWTAIGAGPLPAAAIIWMAAAIAPELGRHGPGLEAILPSLDPAFDVLELALELLVGLLAEDAAFLDEIVKQRLAALLGEDAVGDVLEHGLLEERGGDGTAAALLLADAKRAAAVVVSVAVLVGRRPLPRGLKLVGRAALAALGSGLMGCGDSAERGDRRVGGVSRRGGDTWRASPRPPGKIRAVVSSPAAACVCTRLFRCRWSGCLPRADRVWSADLRRRAEMDSGCPRAPR